MIRSLLLAPALAAALVACTQSAPAPSTDPTADFNISGTYVGRIVGDNGRSVLLDAEVREQDLNVTVRAKRRDTGEAYLLTGTRSVFASSPVQVDAVAELGSGSPCEGGFTDRLILRALFQKVPPGNVPAARGSLIHLKCNASERFYFPDYAQSGFLELSLR